MKKFLALVFIFTLLQSCDDGDIIVTNFNFDDVDLKTCGDVGDYVFYKINPQSFESLSLKLGVTDSLYNEPNINTFSLSEGVSFVNYRRYDGNLGSGYFCSSIPPASPMILEDYKAVSGAAVVTVTFDYDDEDPTQVLKNVQVTLKDLVLVHGEEQIILETLNMGTVNNVRL